MASRSRNTAGKEWVSNRISMVRCRIGGGLCGFSSRIRGCEEVESMPRPEERPWFR
jgi:hypothetical protein